MSATTATLEAGERGGPVEGDDTSPDTNPETGGHKDALRAKHAHAGVAMAASAFAMAAASGLQAVLYLSSFGVNARTDGFFAAFANAEAAIATPACACLAFRASLWPPLPASRVAVVALMWDPTVLGHKNVRARSVP